MIVTILIFVVLILLAMVAMVDYLQHGRFRGTGWLLFALLIAMNHFAIQEARSPACTVVISEPVNQ